MRNITTIKKLFVLSTAVLLIGFNFSIFASAHLDTTYEDEGIIIDTFEDSSDITLHRCVYNSTTHTIVLDNGSDTFTYNYSGQPDSLKAWENPFGVEGGIIPQFISPSTMPGAEFEKKEMAALKDVDNDRLITESGLLSKKVEYVFSPIHHFQFKTNQKADNINNITIKWWYGSYEDADEVNLKEISLWVWLPGSLLPHWKKVVSVEYNESNFNKSTPDISYSEDDSEELISEDGHIDILIVGSPDSKKTSSILYTDFVQLEIKTKKGYFSEGTVISNPITPTKFGRWESVFWTSSKPSSASSVTVEILDENSKPIGELSSTTSPMDISSVKNKTIRLKAILRSKSAGVTPVLYSWGVIWERTDEYKDSFSTTYKVSDTKGVKIQSGEVSVNEFYGDWSFFGKNPDNTRAYDGKAITTAPKDLYWYSKDKTAGGGFRQVIAKNGKVYVPGSDNRIYVFNATSDSSSGRQKPVFLTSPDYNVDVAIGVTDKCLIIGTCNSNSANKIYALNLSDNLTGVKWEYPKSNETLCFSAPLTIYDDKIFITSWSGRLWDIPLLSFINKFLPGNNRVIALNADTGEELWDPVALPASSFSAPAVGNGMVYVGCQNMWGSSLFAYDIETGEEVWNQSVGVIGKSSPVYADGKVFVLTREIKNISSSGTNKIVAVDANSGEILWNKTIGDTSTMALLNVLKSFRFLRAIVSSAPISTPAFYDDTLFVVTPDGKLMGLTTDGGVKYSFNISTKGLMDYYVTSPLVVDDLLYVTTSNMLYVYNISKLDKNNTKPIWSYEILSPDKYLINTPPDIIASPIIADGLMLLSVTEDPVNLTGRVYCIGNYSKNTEGYIISNPIHLPEGYWWNSFTANNVTSKNNTITYSVLDEDNNVLITGLNGTKHNISGLTTNVIKLYAKINVGSDTEPDPVLKSWEVTWTKEDKKPEFILSSFEPGQDGWVSGQISECSIVVKDNHEGASGIDVNNLRYKIGYIEKDTGKNKTSSWIEATSYDGSGVKQTRIYANIQDSKLKIDTLLNITFLARDLAGNENTSSTIIFKVDKIKPSSHFVGSYKEKYNQPFVIVVDATDDTNGSTNGSGVQKVYIKYRYKTSENAEFTGEWKTYNSTVSPFTFDFEPDKSGYYQLISIAEDNASNLEEINSAKIASALEFLFDMYKPTLNTSFTTQKWKTIPEYELEIYDDFKLDSLYYMFSNQTQWTIIKDNINASTYKITWKVPQEYWIGLRDGENRSVSFKITDVIGNTYISKEIKIIKDENASSFFVDTSDFSQWHWDNKFTIKPKYPADTDVTQVKLYYKYSKSKGDIEKQNYTEYKNTSEEPYAITFTPDKGSGYYIFYMEIIDSSGAVHKAYSDTVSVTLFPTTLFTALITILVILIILTSIILIKIRKKRQL